MVVLIQRLSFVLFDFLLQVCLLLFSSRVRSDKCLCLVWVVVFPASLYLYLWVPLPRFFLSQSCSLLDFTPISRVIDKLLPAYIVFYATS